MINMVTKVRTSTTIAMLWNPESLLEVPCLSLASVALGIIYYLTLISAKNGDSLWGNPSIPNQGGIAMGQPQIPTGLPQSSTQDPVFVHEDTYIRRQFTWLVILCSFPVDNMLQSVLKRGWSYWLTGKWGYFQSHSAVC